jgi:tryptophan-rich sensory protein
VQALMFDGVSGVSVGVTALAVVATAGSGAALTASGLVPWYRDLRKPTWNPTGCSGRPGR